MERVFQQTLKKDLDSYLVQQQYRFPREEVLTIDLHCHDRNSDIPDELIGRILGVPETWLESERLLQELKLNGCDTFTITNHNNARSCYEMQDKGHDILTAAEFSCFVPDYETGIHVLAYGFTPEQETRLNKLRKNIYAFQEYTCQENLPTIWAHPLFNYTSTGNMEESFFRKMLLLFERFEAFNGQRDTWQNMLVKEWITQVNEEQLEIYAKEFGITTGQYCREPYKKVLTGGSDSHMGIFAGMTGSRLYIPGLQEKLASGAKHSELALEALRFGNIAPFGGYQNTEKLTIAFLNYACQIAMNFKDPGLVRLLLHQGDLQEKIISLVSSNIFSEVKRHRVTMSFIKLFYDCMMGKSPSGYKRFLIPSSYKPIFDEASGIAGMHTRETSLVQGYYGSVLRINELLNKVLADRLHDKIKKATAGIDPQAITLETFLSRLELPTEIRAYLGSDKEKQTIDIASFLDGLSFPFFSSLFILAAHFTSTKTLYNTRPFLNQFSKRLGKYQHPERILWLTDTYEDKNGVSLFLQEMHREIKKRNLPIDILVCSNTIREDKNLRVLKSIGEFSIPAYQEQPFYVPNFVELHNLFLEGEYDRIVCSTEGIMGLCALYLKQAYSVECTFYMHTDWLMFTRKVIGLKGHNLNRMRRFLRFFYRSFDRVMVLNSDQKKWLTGSQMNLLPEQVHQTAHWVNARFKSGSRNKETAFGLAPGTPVLLYAGRISHEKGVMELSYIYNKVRETIQNVEMVIIGKGPALEELKEALPEATYIDWVDQQKLPNLYASADLLLLPSRFDTFCNVVLESLSCGLPVVAYNTKGPKDIILDCECGYLVESKSEMAECTIGFLQLKDQATFRTAAIKRAAHYNADHIINDFIRSVGIAYE